MTFENTRKKQVLVLQPRGKALYEDESSFGSKMMAKMGWSKGSGLGKNSSGNVEFIQVRYKNNEHGLGFNGLKDDQWTENESNFDNLLKALNGNSSSNSDEEQKLTKKSLVEKSESSRARVHYKKRIQGKDVHKYSEKDLANILGKKSLTEVETSTVEETVEIIDEPEAKSAYDSNLIVNTGVNLKDYFKEKLAKKKNKLSNDQQKVENFEENVETVNSDTEVKKKKKKNRKSSEEVEVTPVDEKPKKKKKKEKIELEILETEETEDIEKPKKKKKSKAEDEIVEEITEIEVDTQQKKKKKRKMEEVVHESDEMPKEKKLKNQKSEEVVSSLPSTSKTCKKSEKSKSKGEIVDAPKGLNAVYNTNVITIPSYTAQKIAKMEIEKFHNSNIANIIGYGLTEDIEIRVIQTKFTGNDNLLGTDKYSLYNTDKVITKRVNPRKILSSIKKIKRSIQVI